MTQHPLHPNEKLVFGSDAKRHEITGMILESAAAPCRQTTRPAACIYRSLR